MMMKTLATPSTEAASDILFPTSVAPLSADDVATTDRLLATLQALSTKESTPKDPAIAALLQSLNASTKFRQRANGNRRARRSIRIKRMYPKSHVCTQKHAQGFGRKQTQTDCPPHHPHHPHHPASKVLRSHAAQTTIDRYTNAASLGDAIQPTFTQIASSLPTGSAPADLSAGWDGTLWAIDEQGAPHIYDPINNEWNVHGEGIDAAAAIGETFYHFRGNQYVTVNLSTFQTSIPLPITTIATNPRKPLPRSFQLGITGAATVGNTLYLFHGGRYWPVDGSQDPLNLIDIPGWPASAANWKDGVIDAAYMNFEMYDQITLRHGNEGLYLKFITGQGFQVAGGPTTVSQIEQTINAGTVVPDGEYPRYFYYSGVTLVPLGDPDPTAPPYIPTVYQNWPATWNPVLTHAPSGRMGNLWVATKDGNFVHHNGESWSLALPDAQATSVSVGNDNSVWMAHHSATASEDSFPGVYTVGAGGKGIPDVFDLSDLSDRSFAFDYDSSGKQDHLVFYRTGNGTAGTGKIVIVKNNGDGSFTQVYPAPGTSASAIGKYSFDDPGNPLSGQPGNLGFAFDYDGSGNLDHLVFYRPGLGAISILKNQGGTFTPVYQMGNFSGNPNTGIGGYDLRQPPDRGFAFDYDGSGKLDHLVFYRPGAGAIFIIKKQNGNFTPVYQQAGHGNGIGGFDLMQLEDKGFAYDYDGTGKLDHLVFYRPGAGAISILKNNSGSFTAVYQQSGSGNGIGDFPLSDPNDKGFAFDCKGTGKQNYLVFYSPGTRKISVLQNFNGNFLNVYSYGQTHGTIGGFDLARPEDLGFSFDATGSGNQHGLVFYRPGEGAIFILKTELDYTPILGGWANGSFTEHDQPPGGISQVSVGDASRVWVRDGQNNVMQYDSQSQQYNPNAQVEQATHIGANNDGTLWHCYYDSTNPNNSQNKPYAHRLVSESTAPSEQLSVNSAVASVQRVATTGFGSSHCLAQHSDGTQGIYRYDSPYVFKTSEAYPNTTQIVAGLGRIYTVRAMSSGTEVLICALDMHTGAELATRPITISLDWVSQTNIPVLDPINELVYFFYMDENKQPTLAALDAYTLVPKWSFSLTQGNVFAGYQPTLDADKLCVLDSSGTLYMFDTGAALANAPNPEPLWKTDLKTAFGGIPYPLSAYSGITIVRDRVYAVLTGIDNDGNNFLSSCACAAIDGSIVPSSVSETNSGNLAPNGAQLLTNAATIEDQTFRVYIPCFGGVVMITPYAPMSYGVNFNLSTGSLVTGIYYDDGSRLGSNSSSTDAGLWFGDDVGNIWCLDPKTLQPLQKYCHHVSGDSANPIWSTLVIYKDTSGGATVFFGLAPGTDNTGIYNLYGYDPESTNIFSVPTGATYIASLSQITNGVLYAAGGTVPNASTSSLTDADSNAIAQVFGIRVDPLVQTTRDFIIESQMMQDPDESAPNGNIVDPNNPPPNPIPPSVNRYQTHLTVVDNNKSPRAKEPLKIWADKPNTQITLGSFSGTPNGPNGTLNPSTNTYTCTIGPDDGDFVSVSAGVDGAITMVSDATDMYATPLRVWASFMNSYERIVVNPDQEFHTRVTTAHADASNNDPTKVNLATTTNYTGTPLFSSDEVTAGQPAQTATAVGQMKQGLNLGGTNTSTRLSYSRLMQGSRLVPHSPAGLQLAATSQAYTAYTDLHGMGYFATNVPSQRPVTPVQSVGFIYTSGFNATKPPTKPNTPCTAAKIETCSHSDALAEIDTWTGDPWQPSDGSVEGMLQGRRRLGSGLGNWWTDFWNWLSNAVEKVLAFVQKVVVAIGDAVMVGINMIVNGIEQVFHCKIQFLEDIAAAIGSFFNMLEKVLSDVLQALSILFQFGEIINTQKWLKQWINNQLTTLDSTINTYVIPKLQDYIAQGKEEIGELFDNALKTAPSQPINQQQAIAQQPQTNGGLATPHTAYTVGYQSGSPSSQAVQSSWGTQKMQTGLPSSKLSSTYKAVAGVDPFSNFLANFLSNLETSVSQDFSKLQSQFSVNFSSPSSFFESIIHDFLLALEGLIDIGFDVAIALVGSPGNPQANPPIPAKPGLLDLFGQIITYLVTGSDGNPGILDSPIEIPVLTWLFKTVTGGEDLTLLNLITLVAAIPVTILFRVIEGRYPSEAGFVASASATSLPTEVYTLGNLQQNQWTDLERLIAGPFNIVISGLAGFISALGDADPDGDSFPPFIYTYCLLCLALIPLGLPYATEETPGDTDWIEFGLSTLTYLISIMFTLATMESDPADPGKPQFVSGSMCFWTVICLIIYSIFFGEQQQSTWNSVSFAATFLSNISGVINPLKWTELKPVVVVLDVATPVTAAVMTFVDWTEGTTST